MKRTSALYAFFVILLCAAFLFYKYILQVYPGIITPELMSEFHLDGVGLGNLAANYFYAYLITQIFAGILLDKYSTRILSTIAIMAAGLGALIFSKTYNIHMAELGRLLMGFGTAFATVCYLKNTAVWCRPERFAFVSGLLATAAMLGAIFGQTPLSILVQHVTWRVAIWYVGLVGLLLGILFLIVVRDHNPKNNALAEVKYGLAWHDIKAVLKNKQNWLLTFYSGLIFTPVAVFGGLWGNPFLVAVHHLSTDDAATAISGAFFGLAVGAPLLGLLSDHLKQRKKIMMLGTLLAAVAISIVVFMNDLSLVTLTILLFIFGFGIGAFMLCFAIGKETNSIAVAATVVSMINLGDPIFGSFTEPLIGKILDLGWHGQLINGVRAYSALDYHIALSLLPLYLISAALFLSAVKETR
jgi:MFS family permease